jgi:hypothetical protein
MLISILATPNGSSYVAAIPSMPYLVENEQTVVRKNNILTYKVKETKATSGTHHQSISDAIAKGRMPQNSARVCL